ncbi:unnamed protein product [Spirodela intermedia]|uniref:WW domain-containing protein n=1 Tax=Spirodela intermedia TaxID=51605 RepID=A0A7I8KV44_SPIIN|nr:unnamed protein product [Spirodela intermedia]
MVSLQGALSPRERRACPTSRPGASPTSSRKRKWEEGEGEGEGLPKELKLWNDGGGDSGSAAVASSDVDLHLDTPLPPEWQRCLDIQSGKIHFYNTRTQRRTSRDPRRSAADEPPPVSLDLELNLTCETSPPSCPSGGGVWVNKRPEKGPAAAGAAHCKAPSWASLDTGAGEMVAAVCGRCHMLVMMSRLSPSCPNCKFSHLPEDMPPSALLKPEARALVL